MASTNFYLKSPDSTGKSLISMYFRFTENKQKQQVVFSSNESVNQKDWDKDTQRVRRSLSGYSDINNNLNKMEEDVNGIYRQLNNIKPRKVITPEIIKEQLSLEYGRTELTKNFNLVSFAEFYLNSVLSSKSPNTIKGYKTTIIHLKEYAGKQELLFDDIDLDFYNNFKQYLIETKNLSTNTVGKYIKNVKVFLNEATERGINKNLDFKSKRFKIDKEETETIFLTESEIENIFGLDLSKNPRLERVRDLFIVGCWTGLRFSDFSQIASENIKDGFITIRTQKTDKTVSVPIHRMVAEIMDKYKEQFDNSLPLAISNQKMNEYLKEIGKMAGIIERIKTTMSKGSKRVSETYYKYELITTHTARRSFATNLTLRGFPSIYTMQITGHRTEGAFMKYIKTNSEQIAMKLQEFWGNQEKKLVAV